ncbi:Ppx/GppA family phosphatase [Ruoffia tabacinasalis]|uniref:Ppx/GppA family phosphatase n=1 Tax=Ruoffia tabacinasalis TaxID=87458 RepID=UPI0030D10725
MYKEVVGVIDIGSNTIRLVIFGLDEQYNYIEIQNIKTPARLSQYLITDKDGENPQMSQDGIDKLIETLISFRAVAESFNVAQILPMATAAVRQSVNKASILEQVKEATGLDINLVSEEEEASYGQYAITHSTVVNDAITIDIGGGSCEITYYEDKNMVQYHSFPFGAVSLSKQFFQDKDHNDPNAIEAVQEYVRKQFKQFDWIKKAKLPIVAIGGSARNIANVHQRLVDYQMAGVHGYSMDEDDIEETLNLFISTDIDDMTDIEGLSADRRDLIIPANIVFLELFKVVKAKTFQLSSQGLREGIILKYINQTYNSPLDNQLIRVRSIRQVVRDFPINTVGSQIIVDIIISLYQQLCNLGLLTYSYETQEEIEFAAYIYRFGGFISPEADSQHTFYLLSNMNLMGFSHPKRLRLALLASYRNRSLFKQYLTNYENWLTDDEISDLEVLGGVLKFSSALNDSKTGPIEDLKLYRTKDNNYKLDIYHSTPVIAEKYRSMRHAKHFERALDGDLEIEFIQK